MIFGSVCSGIEAASVAWRPLGWEAAFLSEIDPFARAVLQHHHKGTPLHGDFTTIESGSYRAIDALVGGTPCQSFSVAGLRGGMADPRGNLALGYLGLADRLRPRWVVWENVPGVLSSHKGRDFGSFLGGLAELGYGFAYRVLDAQHFGVPQRRRRVFVVGYLGDWRRAAAVLFERHSLSGDPPPRREAGQGVAGTVGASFGDWSRDNIGESVVPAVSFALRGREGGAMPELGGDQVSALRASSGGSSRDYIAFDPAQITSPTNRSNPQPGGACHALAAEGKPPVLAGATVRRLTPRECERLQGFPDDYTQVPWKGKPAPDSRRYKAVGNSMAVPVMRWLGERIQMVEGL